MASEHVLVVDDEEELVELVQMRLEHAGYRVSTAADGLQALAMARQVQPHLVLLDVLMPGLNGIQVCEALKSDPATQGIRIIIVSAKVQQEDQHEGLAAGADAYLTKPFTMATLMQEVASHLPHDLQ